MMPLQVSDTAPSTADTALVVLSGGQDSVTCLGVALASGHELVHAVTFDYGQRHANAEIECARMVCARRHVPHKIIKLPFLANLVPSALLDKTSDVSARHGLNSALPASFVPVRNALFMTIAHGYAQSLGAKAIYLGVCQTDYSGYPDCRKLFVDKMESALNIGYETSICFLTPLMLLTKADTFRLANHIGFLEEVISYSHTCYNGVTDKVHAWGRGCGECPACHLRAKGYAEFVATMAGKERQ